MDREAAPRIVPTSHVVRALKRLPHAASLALVVAGAAAMSEGCSNTTSSGTDLGVPSIIFIQRVTEIGSGPNMVIDVAGGNGQVIDYQRYEPGGSLNILSPPRVDGTLTSLTSEFTTADFNGADVSFDATQVVFSMKKDPNDNYHIYTVSLTPGSDGKYQVHQLTAGDQDDINPVWLPGGVIGFATNEMYTAMGTRADEYNHSRVATQLATITATGGDANRHLFPQSISHSVSLFPRYDGKLGYSRWEHLGGVNDVKLFTASPDGTNMIAVAGQHGKPSNSLFNVREVSPNVMVGIATDRERTIHAGALVMIDARNQSDPVCLDPSLDKTGHTCLDEEHVQYTILTPDVPTDSSDSPAGRYREPSPLPDGRILTSWANGPVNDSCELSETPPDFGIYVYDPVSHINQLVWNDRTVWDLNAQAVVARQEPPVIGSIDNLPNAATPATLGSINIANTSLEETVNGAQFNNVPLSQALQSAVAVRVVEGFSSEAAKGVSMFGLTMDEGAAVLGTAPVYPDGSWLANVPAFVPVHLQPIDKYGLSIRNQRLWIQAAPGNTRACGGCHESRTGEAALAAGQNPSIAGQRGPQQFTEAIPDRAEYSWMGAPAPYVNVQDFLNANCTSCHNDTVNGNGPQTYYTVTATNDQTGLTTTYSIPYLDLSDTPVTVYYDRETHTWPASYVSLFYPATLMMGSDDGETMVVASGKVAPMWEIPEDARNSVLIQKLNVQAADGTYAWPIATNAMHPEDVGVTITADDRQMMIRTADLGGQYYSRQNTGFVPFSVAEDPVAAGTQY
jgi:hypothetical protein